jgi:hypothetical protein
VMSLQVFEIWIYKIVLMAYNLHMLIKIIKC